LDSHDLKARLGLQNLALRDEALAAIRLNYEDWRGGQVSLEAACAAAGQALDRYAATTLETLLSSTDSKGQRQSAGSVSEHYREAVGSFAREIRGVFADARGGHAVAQVLQTLLLRAETRLRNVRHSR
jgi:hypothetical protein